jgi:enoyl-[acyl-carrier-protein] reductase (NADH)
MRNKTHGESTPGDATMKIFAATIEHRHGTNLYLAASQEDLTAQIYDYVVENWEAEIIEPLDADDATPQDNIEYYFEQLSDQGGHSEFLTSYDPQEVG